jgi:DNA-binding response OmpR family regulator
MKIEPDPANPEYIVTVRGSGYAFEEDTRPRFGAPRKS